MICSLLKPAGYTPPLSGGLSGAGETDLGLGSIVQALDLDGRHSRFISATLAALPTDLNLINYRQDILADLLGLPKVVAGLGELLPAMGELTGLGRGAGWAGDSPLHQVASRLNELQVYITCVESLWQTLSAVGDELKAAGLLALRDYLAATRREADYIRLASELPRLRAQFEQAGSITLGLNLDAQLRPESVTILSVNPTRFSGKGSFLGKLLGDKATPESVRGISGLYKSAESQFSTPEHELYRDMNRMLERIAAPVAQALAQFTRINSVGLASLEPELVFYLGAVQLINNLRGAGLALCRPTIVPAEERAGSIQGGYSLDLALRWRARTPKTGLVEKVITNEVAFGPAAMIFVLTGPNSGGKTTYTRAIGQAQVLAQAGLFVPGQAARLSPVDAIFTHFTTAERPEDDMGRLAEELGRLSQIFRQASPSSLILLNEPLASTDHASATALSRELLAGLRWLGARAIFVTHVHELADETPLDSPLETSLDESPEQPAGVLNLVAGLTFRNSDNGHLEAFPTYKIEPGRPQTPGYAAELARRYGLSLPQIKEALKARGKTEDGRRKTED